MHAVSPALRAVRPLISGAVLSLYVGAILSTVRTDEFGVCVRVCVCIAIYFVTTR